MSLQRKLLRVSGRILLAGLVSWLVAGAPALKAAQAAKSSKAAKSTSTGGRARIARLASNPYLGAIVVDAATGKVLFEHQADTKGYPASVLKLMDLLIVLEQIQQGHLTLQDQVVASAKASHTGGSRVWLKEKESFTVDEMLYALMVQSANDVAVALAEKIGGTTDGFIELMNKRAKELGMNSTTFHSVNGLPPSAGQEPDVTSARDLSILCRELLKHPETLRYTSTRARPFGLNVRGQPVDMTTHNHLLGHLDGCDGLKTGWIDAAGYSIAITVARNNQRVVVIVLDSADRKVRDAKASELAAKGFAALSGAPSTPAPAPAAKAAAVRKK